MKKVSFLTIITAVILAFGALNAAKAQVVINEIYTAGGNAGATYNADYIELFNIGTTAVNLSTYSIQYATAAGDFTTVRNLTGTIPARGYYLIRTTNESAMNGATLPAPNDAFASPNLNTTDGNVILVSNQTAIGVCANSTPANGVIDRVGYGTGACFQGTGDAPSGTLTMSITRIANNGNNATDFAQRAPNPQNAASPTAAPSSISGRVSTLGGRPIAFAFVKVVGGDLTEPLYARTDNRGSYTVEGLTAGESYIVEVGSKFYEFDAPTQFVTLSQSVVGINFIGNR